MQVLLQFSLSILNNITFGFKIPVPLHMLYRSGSLIFSVIMGYLLYRTTYSRQKLIGVAIVTVGIFLSTRASMPSSPPSPVTCTNCNEPAASASVNNTAEMEYDMVQFVTGIIILTVTVLMASGLSCYQDTVFKQHGKEPIEALFYTHAMSLPWFAVASSSILDSWTAYNKSDVETYTGLPILWLLLICNVITQYACIRGVYILLSSGSALTTNLVITLRKFTSLIVSVALFNNRFTVCLCNNIDITSRRCIGWLQSLCLVAQLSTHSKNQSRNCKRPRLKLTKKSRCHIYVMYYNCTCQ